MKVCPIKNLDAMEEQIIFFRTHLDIAIEVLCAPIKLSRDQHVIAREIGNCMDSKVTENRGAGKTWLIALCVHVLSILYPECHIGVCSQTAAQATLVLRKIKEIAAVNENVANELVASQGRNFVSISKEKATANYKNGSWVESFSIESMRGIRLKIAVMD